MGNILNVKTSAADDIFTLVLFTLRVHTVSGSVVALFRLPNSTTAFQSRQVFRVCCLICLAKPKDT